MQPLSKHEIAALVEVIRQAEEFSTGEIRIHIDSQDVKQLAKRAYEIFKTMCKDKTKEKNAVLFHINFEQKYLTIIGDSGIHQKVSQEFWDKIHDNITEQFAKGQFFEAIKQAILETGYELKKHFPIQGKNPNELPNEISFS